MHDEQNFLENLRNEKRFDDDMYHLLFFEDC